MLLLKVPKREMFDEETETFSYIGPWQLQLEHSLVSLSKWEAFFKKPFLSKQDKTMAETKEYVKCMSIVPNINQEAIDNLSIENLQSIKNYIEDPMSASTPPDPGGPKSRETATSELIYYWMISLNIPFECQKWHLNRLLTLIEVCNFKNAPQKKMNKRAVLAQNKALNDARRAKFNTSG